MSATNSQRANLADFLRDNDDATKAKYAAELEHAGDDWRPALDRWYAESLVYFGLLEFRAETLYRGQHVCGSRGWFRKVQKPTTTVSISNQLQTELAL